jgi:hypothetical protein
MVPSALDGVVDIPSAISELAQLIPNTTAKSWLCMACWATVAQPAHIYLGVVRFRWHRSANGIVRAIVAHDVPIVWSANHGNPR